MDRVGVFIDAGYLFAGGSILLTGRKLRRGLLHLDNSAFLDFIRKKAEELTGLPLLRVYWYDGTDGPPTPAHIALAYQPDVKLRLGLVNRQGAQKGVDSLVVTDLINLATNRAMASAVLMTGDEDIRVGVQQAQAHGVRVHLVGIAATPGGERNLAALLHQEADHVCHLTKEEVGIFLKPEEAPAEGPPASAATSREPAVAVEPTEEAKLSAEQMSVMVSATIEKMDEDSIRQVAIAGRYSIPSRIDGTLLATATEILGGQRVPQASKKQLRDLFFEYCERRTPNSE